MIAIVVFIAMAVYLLLNIPVPVAVSLSAMTAMTLNGGMDLQVVVQRMFYGLNNYIYLAIPLFVLLGQVMMAAKITERLVDFALVLVGHMRGGLAQVAVVACAVMSSISGSSSADAAATGAVLGPSMVKQGYPPGFASAVIGAASAGAALIPPSITMIVYASLANVSIGRLFVAGIMPGILVGAALMFSIWRSAVKYNLPVGTERPTVKVVGQASARALLVLLAPIIIIGGVVGGVFTPTESAAVAVLYTLFLAFVVYRSMRLRDMIGVLERSLVISAQLMLTLAAASIFSWIIARAGLPNQVAQLPIFQGDNGWVVLLLVINVVVFLLGIFLEGSPLLVIVTPIFLAPALAAGIDPTHLGIVLAINLAIGGISPPFGMLMFVACAVTPATMVQFSKAIVPFIVLICAVVLVISYIPQISLWLPDILGL